ncbi:MAG: glycosyltransferase, partial [Anaerolineae bacterium]
MADIRVVYVLLRFPWLTETFVAEEIRSIQAKGVSVCIYALLPSREPCIHSVSRQLLPQVKYAPGLLSGDLWSAQAYYLLKAPRQYAGLLGTVLRQPSPRISFIFKRFAILLKGIWLARQLQHESVDLIHTHFAWLSAIAGIVVSQLLGIPFTLTAHAYDIYSVKNDLLRLATGAADGIVTISETNKRAILAM